MEQVLGKIEKASFGLDTDRPFLYGIHFVLTLENGGVVTNKTINISEVTDNHSFTVDEQKQWLLNQAKYIKKILNDAKVNYINELKDKPIIATFDKNRLVEFRILTEVL